MANVKISDVAVFIPTTDITTIDGMAAYTGAGAANASISGLDLVASLEDYLQLTSFTQMTSGQPGEALTVDPAGTNLEWKNPNEIDFEGLDGATARVDLTAVTTQPLYGHDYKYTVYSGGAGVLCGQPTMNNYFGGVITASEITTLPSQDQIIGISRHDTGAGAGGAMLLDGYATARFNTQLYTATDPEVRLTVTTNQTTHSMGANSTPFRDSGGAGGAYNSNENYYVTFDAGPGNTVDIEIIDFEYEIIGTDFYDRMAIQTSPDDFVYTNHSEAWMLESDDPIPPYSEANPITGGSPGWIFPDSDLSAGVPVVPFTISTGTRYARFYFVSDFVSTYPGWDFNIKPNIPYTIGNPAHVGEGTTLFLDNTDWTRVTTDTTTGVKIGYCAYSDTSNNSIFVRLLDTQTW